MKATILDQIKELIVKYIYSLDNPYNCTIVGFIWAAVSIEEIIKHVDYWGCFPPLFSAESYVFEVINNDFDATIS